MITTYERFTIFVIACLVVALCTPIANAQKRGRAAYSIVPFMPPDSTSAESSVSDVNEMGQAVGWVRDADGTIQGLHLDMATGAYTLLAGGPASGAGGLNDFNQIVGDIGDIGAFWASPLAEPITLPPLPGHVRCWAAQINNAGFVTGGSDNDSIGPEVPVVWRVALDANGDPQVKGPWPLEPLDAGTEWWGSSINESSFDGTDWAAQIAGWSFDGVSGETRAVVWTVRLNEDGTLTPEAPVSLGTLGLDDPSWSMGAGINDFGDVCGTSDRQPFVAPTGDALQALSVPRGTYRAIPSDINESGEIVGYVWFYYKRKIITNDDRAHLWRGGEVISLRDEIDRKSGWGKLRWAYCINNEGIIGGSGTFDGDQRGFLLIPNSP
jgi:hypothetical protein